MIPTIDSKLGILVYSTSFAGCGGKIKNQPEDFFVSEVLTKKSLSLFKEDDGYAIFKLKKRGLDTTHALDEIQRKHGLRLKSLGLKDAMGVTEQYACSMNKSKHIPQVSEKKYSLKKIGCSKKPLTKKMMVGNKFQIKIINASEALPHFSEFDKILNFYGYQRFGSKRPVTHLIGKEIVHQNYQKAVDLLLSETSQYDSSENTELRKKLADKSNFPKVLEKIPPQMDLERIVVKEMIKTNDSFHAIRCLPLNIRRFFVQAYQSYLFNQTLSAAFEYGENLFEPQEGDVCFDQNQILCKYENTHSQKLAVPLVGHSYYKKTRFHFLVSKILEKEELSPKDFFLKELQEASAEGGFRNSSIQCQNFSISGNVVAFLLGRGSYATIILREIMKPKDPILAGF